MRQQSLVLMISFILLGMTAVHPPFTPLNSVSASKAPTTENITSYLPPGGTCRLPGDKIISDDGQYALVQCFYSLNHPHNGLYLLNMAAKTASVLKDVPATAGAAISANGVYVAVSFGGQIIRYDLMATPVASSAITITLTSRGALGNGVSSNPEISEDGRYVAFNSTASNLASDPNEQLDDRQDDIFLHDTQTRTTVLITPQVPNYWSVGDPSLSPSGTQVLYSYGLAGSFVMLYDRTSGITANVSKNFDGTPGFGTDYALAANSTAAWRNISSLVGIDNDHNGSCDQSCLFNTIYARKPATGNQPAIPISVAVGGDPENGGSGDTVISGNGRFVAFYSGSTNLIPETLGCCGHIFLRDTLSGTTELISVAPNGNTLSASPLSLSMSQNGCALAFSSDRLYIRFRGGDCPTLPPPPTDCTVIGGFKVAEGICGKDQDSIKLAVADLTNPDVKVALATEIVSQTAGLFHLHTVEDLVLHNTPVGANGVARHNYVAINGTAFQRGCNLVNLSCESTGAASIFGLNGWIYGTKGGGRGDASKLDTTNPSFFSFAASRTAIIHRRREPESGNIGDFNQGDTTYITNAIMGADFAVGFGRLILDDTYIAGDDAYGAKTAVGVSKDGKRVFIAVGGFFTSSKELADSLKVVGAYRAVLLDGGGSPQITSVVAEGQDLEYYVSYRIITRSVINGIVLYNAASRTSIDTALTTSGGTFTLGPGVTATFAPNTFISTTTLSYAPIATPNDDSYVSLDRAFRLTAQGTATAAVRNGASFVVNRAYTLTVSYDQRLLPATMSAASFGIYTLTETGWHREPTSAVNQSAHTITAQINHFGDFAVLSPRPDVMYLPLTIR